MENNTLELESEKAYLNNVNSVIQQQLENEKKKSATKRNELISARRDMYENTVHASNDFDRLSDTIQYLNPLEIQTYDYEASSAKILKYEKMKNSPYFARIDFEEDGFEAERIYIGLGNLTDEKTRQTYICDWRAPISSIFYRYGLGRASYTAPFGTISGNVLLKRQYEIKNGMLQYYFDSSLTIMDDMLKQALSLNSSAKMKSIVETIQQEQDIIIRDIENDVLIVQGVAGSGKTSVALHRIAFLMYHGLTVNLNKSNIVIIAPSNLFSQYIENVLPELGEKNVQTITYEDMYQSMFQKSGIESRNALLETIITESNASRKEMMKTATEFMMSRNFITILDRYLKYYEYRMIEFIDVFYNGECIANRHLLKEELLHSNEVAIPLAKRLENIENRIMQKIQLRRKERLDKIEKFLTNYPEHIYEIKPLARLLLLKEFKALKKQINKFTQIDIRKLYRRLKTDKNLFYRMADGLTLPSNMDQLFEYFCSEVDKSVDNYADGMVLLCIKLKISGCNSFKDIKQVVVDEAQDYYPLQYEILRNTFPDAKYTVMGDINQSIEKNTNLNVYNDIKEILAKKSCSTFFMKKSFRCSYEINEFSSNFGNKNICTESFERHESKPQIMQAINKQAMNALIEDEIKLCRELGYGSIAVLCKSLKDATHLYNNVGNRINATLIQHNTEEFTGGVAVLPVYMAKGLEFDAVIVHETNDENYNSDDDRKLLYIACTRALHRLNLFYSGKLSRLVPTD